MPQKQTHVQGDYLKAGGDINLGDEFKVTKVIHGPPIKPVPVSIKIKIVMGERKIVVKLPIGKYTLLDLKQKIIDEKVIDSLDYAIFEQEDGDDKVELTDSVILHDEDIVYIRFSP